MNMRYKFLVDLISQFQNHDCTNEVECVVG